MAKEIVYLLLGSNLGEREWHLATARTLIEDYIGIVKSVSSIYESAAHGYESHHDYLNQALRVETGLSPLELLSITSYLEYKMGRNRFPGYIIDRGIDIDILFYGRARISTRHLTIPHPRMHMRRFVLQPMAELDSEFEHPILRKSVGRLLRECPDQSLVRLIR